MTYPFSDLPTNRQNDTLTVTTHPADHNSANSAINAIKAVLGSAPQGTDPDLTTRLLLLDTLDTTVAELVASGSLLSGVGEPDPADGKAGDFYINTSAITIYGPRAASGPDPWGSPTSLVGPVGPTGPAGGNITTAAELPYDNTTSGLTATDVQAAIDEVAGGAMPGETLDERTVVANESIDMAAEGVIVLDLFDSVSVDLDRTNVSSGRVYGVTVVTQQGLGESGHTVTWSPSAFIVWPKATEPAQATAAGARDVWVFFTTGDSPLIFGFQAGSAMG